MRKLMRMYKELTMNIITKRELVQDNVAAFGHAEAARIAKRQGVCHTHFYWMAFGTAPKQLAAPPTETAAKLRAILRESSRGHAGSVASSVGISMA